MILLVTYKCWYTFDIGKIHKVRMLNLQGNLYYEREKADFFLAHNLTLHLELIRGGGTS
jgi:hypothetical protein